MIALLVFLTFLPAAASAQSPLGAAGRPVVSDTPNDPGRSLTIRWTPSPEDLATGGRVKSYEIRRSISVDGPFERVGGVPSGFTEAIDARNVKDGAPYYYQIVAIGDGEPAASETSLPAVSPGPVVSSRAA